MFKFLSFLTLVFLVLFIPIAIYYYSLLQERNEIRKEVLALSAVYSPPEALRKENIKIESELPEIVNRNFGDEDEDYSVVIKNLKTGEEYKFNENQKYNSASLYKLWIMAVAFQKIKDGSFKEEMVLSGDQHKFDETLSTSSPSATTDTPSEPVISEEPKIISMKLMDAINKMIIQSDNYSALLIAAKEGTFSVTNFLKNNGFKNSNFRSPPQTTASDIALFYEKLYKGEIVDQENSKKMMEILKKQAINDRIPANLPKNVVVAHKTGELFGAKHDAGIVFGSNGDYIIVVMSDTKSPKTAIEKTARFSEEIYNYFKSAN